MQFTYLSSILTMTSAAFTRSSLQNIRLNNQFMPVHMTRDLLFWWTALFSPRSQKLQYSD